MQPLVLHLIACQVIPDTAINRIHIFIYREFKKGNFS